MKRLRAKLRKPTRRANGKSLAQIIRSCNRILKGWFDRVLAHGLEHDTDRRFDRGRYRGRKALFCVTTGSKATESAYNGREGDVQMLLWPTAMTLRYLGFTVLVPEIIHGVHG